jgi:hypothetical protein
MIFLQLLTVIFACLLVMSVPVFLWKVLNLKKELTVIGVIVGGALLVILAWTHPIISLCVMLMASIKWPYLEKVVPCLVCVYLLGHFGIERGMIFGGPKIKPGTSYQEVIEKLGLPEEEKGRQRKTLCYTNGVIIRCEQDVVTSMYFVNGVYSDRILRNLKYRSPQENWFSVLGKPARVDEHDGHARYIWWMRDYAIGTMFDGAHYPVEVTVSKDISGLSEWD